METTALITKAKRDQPLANTMAARADHMLARPS
jgi:hypothetical protein